MPTATSRGAIGMPREPDSIAFKRQRRQTKQHTQGVPGLLKLQCQLRYRRLGGIEHVLGLKTSRSAVVPPLYLCLRDRQSVFLLVYIVASDGNLLLDRSDRDIRRRDVTDERHQHVII